MTQAKMANNIAALVSPGTIRAFQKNAEHMSSNFNIYIELFSNFLTVINGGAATAEKK